MGQGAQAGHSGAYISERYFQRLEMRTRRAGTTPRPEQIKRNPGDRKLTGYRVYYLPVAMLHLATSVARSNLISLGTCFGKFSKTGKFKLGVTSLDWLAKYAKYKVRPPFLYVSQSCEYREGVADMTGLGQAIWRTTILVR